MSTIKQTYDIFLDSMWKKTNHTPEKADWVWSDFWALLISSGFEFAKTDLKDLREWCEECNYRFWYPPGERHYGLSVRDGNISFATAYETLRNHKPFIFSGIDYGQHHRYGIVVHRTQPKTKGRLVLGAKFLWCGEKVKVTSFKDQRHSLIACAYHPSPDDYEPAKVKKRFCISVEDLKKAKQPQPAVG